MWKCLAAQGHQVGLRRWVAVFLELMLTTFVASAVRRVLFSLCSPVDLIFILGF